MRPSDRNPTPLWVRVEEWAKTERFGGPNQTQLAEALGVSTSTITEWKYGDSTPTLQNLIALQKLTDIPLQDMVDLAYLQTQMRRGSSVGQAKRSEQDRAVEGTQDEGDMEPA